MRRIAARTYNYATGSAGPGLYICANEFLKTVLTRAAVALRGFLHV